MKGFSGLQIVTDAVAKVTRCIYFATKKTVRMKLHGPIKPMTTAMQPLTYKAIHGRQVNCQF